MHICISGKLIFHTVQTHFLWLILMYLMYRKDFLGLPVHLISYLKPNPQKHHYILKENNFDKLFANYLQKIEGRITNCQAIMKFPIINCGYLQPWQMNISLVLIRLQKVNVCIFKPKINSRQNKWLIYISLNPCHIFMMHFISVLNLSCYIN